MKQPDPADVIDDDRGLTPLLLERSVQAMFLIPMTVSLTFGVLFATLVSLVEGTRAADENTSCRRCS